MKEPVRYGRPDTRLFRSNTSSVIVQMSNAESRYGFLEMILHEEKRIGIPLPLDSLIILSTVTPGTALNHERLSSFHSKIRTRNKSYLETLVESGLIEAHGNGRARTYTLSAKFYQKTGQKAGYVRQTGFDPIQQEQMVMSYIKEHEAIKRTEVADLCRISPFQAKRLLKKMF